MTKERSCVPNLAALSDYLRAYVLFSINRDFWISTGPILFKLWQIKKYCLNELVLFEWLFLFKSPLFDWQNTKNMLAWNRQKRVPNRLKLFFWTLVSARCLAMRQTGPPDGSRTLPYTPQLDLQSSLLPRLYFQVDPVFTLSRFRLKPNFERK